MGKVPLGISKADQDRQDARNNAKTFLNKYLSTVQFFDFAK